MSTDLYRIRILNLDPPTRRVLLRVFLVYYDWEGVPTDASFFFRILWDEADTRFGGGGPLGHEVTLDQILDEKWVDSNTHRFVDRVTRLSAKNLTFKPGDQPPTFVYDSYKEEDRLTQGDYEVIVTDPRWLQHLHEGQTWQTTSYETHAAMPPGRETQLLDEKPKSKPRAASRKRA